MIPDVVSPPPAESEASASSPVEEEPQPPKPEEPTTVEPSNAVLEPVAKKKKKAPLKPEQSLSAEDLEKVLAKLPDTMQAALDEANEEGKYVFRGASDMAPPATRGASVSRKVFPPPPPTEAELAAAKIAREQHEAQKAAITQQTLAPVTRMVEFDPDADKPVVDDEKTRKRKQKEAEEAAKEATKAAEKLAKEQAKEADRQKKADEQAKKDAAAAAKAAEKARLEAEALAAQEKAEREIFKVENYTPEGFLEAKSLKRIVITFNHPLDTKTISNEPTDEPVWLPKVTPALPDGRWFVSGETENALVYEVEDDSSWPLSTVFAVKIIAGSLGKQNRPLAQELNFNFTTPTMKLSSMFPEDKAIDISPSAPIVLVFDQPIDTKLLLTGKNKQFTLKSGDEEIELSRTEDIEELKALQTAHQAGNSYTQHITGAKDGYWVALLPKKPLPRGASISIHLDTQLSSLLGPAKSREPALNQSFKTRASFMVVEASLHANQDELTFRFSFPLCGPKQDLGDFSWRPTITPAPPVGIWTINEARTTIIYRTDAHVKFTPSTEYIVTLKTGEAKSFYDQPLEKNDSLSFWSTGEPLEQLGINKKQHKPLEVFWWSVVTTLNGVVRMYPDARIMIPGNCVWLLETSQPVDETELAKNITFFCHKTGVLANLTSLVKKEKPHGVCEIVPWNSLRDHPWHRWTINRWNWDRSWAPYLSSRHYVAFKCSLEFPPEHEVELIMGPHLPSSIGPVRAMYNVTRTYEIPTASSLSTCSFVHMRSLPSLTSVIPAMRKQYERALRMNTAAVTDVWGASKYDTTDDFHPTCHKPSAVEPYKPIEEYRVQTEKARTAWEAARAQREQEQQTAVQNHQNAIQQQQQRIQAHQQALVQHAQATQAALAAGQALPAAVPALSLPYVYPSPPELVSPRMSGDLPVPSVDELITPFQAIHALRVSFNSAITHDARVDLGWTPIITPEPPAGKWMLGNDNSSFYYVPTAPWNMSTEYTITVPKNARSFWGVPLDRKTHSSTSVTTPVPIVNEFWWPNGSSAEQPILPTMLIAFSQKVSPADVLPFLYFEVSSVAGKDLNKPTEIPAVLVKESKWKKDDAIVERVSHYAPEKFVIVKPSTALPYRAHVILRVKVKFPSAEGPRLDSGSNSQSFNTVPTFEVTSYAPTSSPLVAKDHLFLRFNQPLVKVSANFVDGDYTLPWTPTIKPDHPGTWTLQRYSSGQLNPTALKFTPSENWARATRYTVTIPAGTASLVGETLVEEFSNSSSTPVVEFVRVWPANNGFVSRKPLIYLEFDSLVNDTAVLGSTILQSKLQVDNTGARSIPLSVVTVADALQNETIAKMVQECGSAEVATAPALPTVKKRSKDKDSSSSAARKWVVLTPTKPLMYNDIISLTMIDLPSAEGTLKSSYSYKLKFNVVGALECQLSSPVAWKQELPSNEMVFSLQFNQPVVAMSNSIPSSFETKQLPAYATRHLEANKAESVPSTDVISATSSSTADLASKTSKSSKSSIAAAPAPLFEFMLSDTKASQNAAPHLEWIVEDDGKRLVTTAPVKMIGSSTYRLTVPVPIISVFDEKLPEAKVFTLRTPTNRIAECWPRPGGIIREVSLNTPVLLRFSQPIDRATILPRLHFHVKKEKNKSILSGIFGKSKKDDKPFCGAVMLQPEELPKGCAKVAQILDEWKKLAEAHDAAVALEAAKAAESTSAVVDLAEATPSKKKSKKRKEGDSNAAAVPATSDVKDFGSPYGEHYWILVRPERPLPHTSRVNLVIGPELPSLLGPNTSPERKLKLFFATAPPLEVSAHFLSNEGSVIFRFNQNMFHNGVKLLDFKDVDWKPLLNVDLPASLYPTWWVLNNTTLKFWVRSWPNATKYVFMIPANGAKSMLEQQLSDRFTYEFEKPTMMITGKLPDHTVTICDPVFSLKFDQFVDPKDIAAHCHIYLKGEKAPYCAMEPIRFADALATCKSVRLYGNNDRVLQPETLFRFRQGAAGKIVWMRPKSPLPPDTKYRMEAGPGLPSLEGPLADPKPVKYSHRTVAPFKITSGTSVKTTRLNPITLYFSNSFAAGLNLNDPAIRNRLIGCITLDPPAPVEKVLCDYSSMRVYIRADALNAPKTYKLTVADWITDEYGQSLSEDIEDPAANEAARSVSVTFEPVNFTHQLVADMGSYPVENATKLMITYDPLLLHHGHQAGYLPSFRLQNVNYTSLRVVLFKMDPESDLPKWVKMNNHPSEKEPFPNGMGTLVSDTTVMVPQFSDPKEYGTQATVDIDLSPALENRDEVTGHIGLVVMPTKQAHNPNDDDPPAVRAWIQCTRLAIEVFPTPSMLIGWVHDMVDSTVVKAARVRTIPAEVLSKDELKSYVEFSEGSTDKNGWVTLDGKLNDYNKRYMIVRKGTDTCILPDVQSHNSQSQAGPRMVAQIWNDRGIYRPKENVEIKGYLREFRVTAEGVPTYSVPALAEGKEAADDLKELKWTLHDPTGSKVTEGPFVISPTFGTFHVTVPLPENINLGNCSISFTGLGPLHIDSQPHLGTRLTLNERHNFVVQEFRRPDFVAKSEILEQKPVYLYGEDALVKVDASYFAGGALQDCEVTWKVASSMAGFSAPGWLGYLFTTAKDQIELANSERIKRAIYEYTKNFTAMTDEKGSNAIRILFKGTPSVCEPVQLVVDIEVLDLNKQALTSQQKLLVHPNRVYLGVKLPNGSNLTGDISSPGGIDSKPFQVMLITADIDGKLVADLPIQVKVCKVLRANSSKLQNVLEVRLVASRAGVPAIFEFDRTKYTATPLIEAYALVVTMTDPATSRMSEVVVLLNDPVAVAANSPSAIAYPIPPPATTISPHRPPTITSGYSYEYEHYNMEDKQVTLKQTPYAPLPVDVLKLESLQSEYKIGEVARVKILTGLPLPAEAVLVIRGDLGNNVLSTQTLSLKDEVSILEFPITEPNAPWTVVHVSAVSTIVREGQAEGAVEPFKRLAQAEGTLQLPVTSNHRELTVVVQPDDPNVAPGAETEVTVRIVDWKSNSVSDTEVALVVIDESVLSMTHHEIPHPFKHFYDPEPMKQYIPQLAQYSLRKSIQLKDIKAVLEDADKNKRKVEVEEIVESENSDDLKSSMEEVVEDDTIQDPHEVVEQDQNFVEDEDAFDPEEPTAAVPRAGKRLPRTESLDKGEDARSISSVSGGGGGGVASRRRVTSNRAPASPKPMMFSFSAGPPPPDASSPARMSAMPSSSASFAPPPPPQSFQMMELNAPMLMAKRSLHLDDEDDMESDASEEEEWEDGRLDEEKQYKKEEEKASYPAERDQASYPTEEKKKSKSRKAAPMYKSGVKGDKDMKKSAPMMMKKENRSLAMERDELSNSISFGSSLKPAQIFAADDMPEEEGLLRDQAVEEEEEEEEEIEELFLRSNFNPLAHFSDAALVNDQGIAKILVKLPDNLTRYRIWAIAVSSKSSKFGMGESLITASLPLQVRITPPRFLNYHDDAELPIVIQNLRDKPIEVKVGVRAIRAILGVAKPPVSVSDDAPVPASSKYDAFLSPDLSISGFLIEIPANGRRLLSVPIKATKAGVCRFQVSVIQGLFGDAQEVRVNVLPPPTTNSFSFSGSLAGGKHPAAICTDLRVPADALPEFGSLEVSLSTTKLQSLSDAAVYLSYIPYEYTEQRASRVMALASLAPLLDALSGSNKKGRYPDAYWVKSTIGSDMAYFKNYQQVDGTYRMWGSNVHSPPIAVPPPPPGSAPSASAGAISRAWLTAQVAQAVAAARAGGFNTHEPLISLFSKSWTQKLEAALVTLCDKPLYSKDSDFAPWAAAKSYTIYAYSKLSKDPKKAAKYAETFYKSTSPQTLSIESIAFLLCVFSEAGHELAPQLVNYLETAVTTYDMETRVSYPDIYSDESRYELFHSRNRADAILLEAIVGAKPDSKLVMHLFRGLMRARVDNKWTNTQDNAFCVVAIHKYFTVFEAMVPDLKARVWLDKDVCVDEAFVGRTTEVRVTDIPMSYVLKNPSVVNAVVVEEKPAKAKKKKNAVEEEAESSDASAVVIEEDEAAEEEVEDPRTKGDENEPLHGKGLVIHKSGKGRLYYTLKISYSPATLKVPAADYGFQVSRNFAPPVYISDLAAVADLLYLREEATWRVKKGSKVRVELKLVVFFPTTFVALCDQLPAGFEPIAVDEHPTREKVLPPTIPSATGEPPAPTPEDAPAWWAHVNLRDSRVEVIADQLSPGTYRFAYVARATMAGHFTVPPTRAEELYQPSVSGNTESTKMEIW